MIRFLKEFFYPRLKCARVGHDMGHIEQSRLEAPVDRRIEGVVAWNVMRKNQMCRRCGHVEIGPELDRYGIHSLKMSDSQWRKFRQQGHL